MGLKPGTMRRLNTQRELLRVTSSLAVDVALLRDWMMNPYLNPRDARRLSRTIERKGAEIMRRARAFGLKGGAR